MKEQYLRDSLENLHSELKNANKIDDESRKILHKIVSDIYELLERAEASTEAENQNLLERLKDSYLKFEVSHPELAEEINIVINSFSNIGA